MNKRVVCVITALALIIPALLSASSGVGTASATITSSGSITSSITTTKLNNVIVIYGVSSLTSAQIATVASNYSMLICDIYWNPATLQSIKTLNPNMKILAYCNLFADSGYEYWATVNANENWFIHNTAGNRLRLAGWPTEYLMDLTSGWKAFYSSYINSRLSGSPLLDGILMDNLYDSLSARISDFVDATTGQTATTSSVSSATLTGWHSNAISYLQYIEANIITGKKVTINTDEYFGNTYLNIVDGEMAEGWVYASWFPFNSFDTLKSWDSLYPIDYIDAMAADTFAGKIYIAASATPTGDASTIAQTANFCYYAALLGVNGADCYFGFKVGDAYTYNSAINYMPDTSATAKLNSPSGAYYLSQNVYMRDFSGGKVIFNPSTNPRTVTIGSGFTYSNGSIAPNTITIPAWSGVILLPQ